MREVHQALLDAALPRAEDKENGAPAVSRAYVSQLLVAFAEEQQRCASRTEEQHTHAQAGLSLPQSTSPGVLSLATGEAAPVLLEALSPQEQRVLRLLIAGQTSRKNEEECGISRLCCQEG